jgi:hypothetical protein
MQTLPMKPEIEIITRPVGAIGGARREPYRNRIAAERDSTLAAIFVSLALTAVCGKPACQRIMPWTGDDEDGECYCLRTQNA